MTNEIKEILDYLAFLEDVDTQKKVKQVADYITNLQTIEQQYSAILSENAELENKIGNLQEENKESEEAVKYWQNQCDLRQMATDKAIEYIEKHTDKLKTIRIPKIEFNYKDLLNILKGEDKE